MRWLAIVVVCAVTWVCSVVLWLGLLRAGIIEPFTSTLRVRPSFYLVTWIVLSWVALRVLGLVGRKSAPPDEEDT